MDSTDFSMVKTTQPPRSYYSHKAMPATNEDLDFVYCNNTTSYGVKQIRMLIIDFFFISCDLLDMNSSLLPYEDLGNVATSKLL